MAIIQSGITFTGSIGDLSAYKRYDSDKIILRIKGGASKEQIKNAPNFANTRRINAEFGGRSTACKSIRRAIWPHIVLADYNFTGPLNALLKPIQVMDKISEFGKRKVELSKMPHLLEGFNLNRHRPPFDSVVRNPLTYTLSRETLSAYVDIPAMLPGINFYAPASHPLYSFIAVLGVVPDLSFDGNKYSADHSYDSMPQSIADSPWYPVLNGSPATRLEMHLSTPPPDTAFSVILSIGIRFGTVADGGVIQQVKRAGCAKVLGMA